MHLSCLLHKILGGTANSADPDQTALTCVCIVCIYDFIRQVGV